ncbi:MAG: carbohydrate ABC transporter permease [Bacillota bacterium]|nr:carbohydrate ABC transporter permease [Bacillota bacterium]HHU61562.1 carbohydrate ABC transporter permease [Natronincola sp.]
MKMRIRKKRLSRSPGGDLVIILFLLAGATFSALPLVFAISNAFKPLSELFLFPPQFFVRHPTLDNFKDLFVLMEDSWVPITRYLFNTLFITVMGTTGHVLMSSLAAYVLAKHKFPGRDFFFGLVVLSLMFAYQVTAIPNYLTMSALGWVNTYASIIIPAWSASLGLFLMKQFMEQIDDTIIEAAKIDGASELRIFWRIVMPNVRPAWLTLIILSFQTLWNETGGRFIYSEQLKTLPYALNQIIAGGVARAGVGAAVGLVMMIVPIVVFVFNQAKVVETMGSAGINK